MTEQTPVEGTPATPEPAAPAAPESPAVPPTAEQVEAEYKARLSGKDRAHAATEQALRDQIAALEGDKVVTKAAADGTLSEVDTLKAQLKAEQDGRKKDNLDNTQTLRTTKYPEAAATLDAATLATMDEAKLAGLEARLTQAPPPAPVDPNTPPATPSAPASTEKSATDLKADLERMSPEFAASLR